MKLSINFVRVVTDLFFSTVPTVLGPSIQAVGMTFLTGNVYSTTVT